MEALREPGMIHVKAMGVFVHKGRVLATRGFDPVKGKEFFRLVGGGVHFCEKAEDALRREIQEEFESDIEQIEFLELIQNVFTYKGNPGHEVIFLFSADLVRRELYEQEEIPLADNPTVIAVWVPVADVVSGNAIVFPETNLSRYI